MLLLLVYQSMAAQERKARQAVGSHTAPMHSFMAPLDLVTAKV